MKIIKNDLITNSNNLKQKMCKKEDKVNRWYRAETRPEVDDKGLETEGAMGRESLMPWFKKS